ncbi:thrombospondin-1-like [Mytilus californianus]|uniref:thrombospondin-1-like n=1 Tax=Mytilus californianus TaxID=6549 RepID=UPI0022462552|nr:thrombospondin-1-like [Mytilus californianus]
MSELIDLPINGNWGSWSSWTSCNSNCGSGKRKRIRRCNNPLPAFGGSSCIGKSEESHTCTGSSCPVRGNWGSWSAWTGCSSSCNSGYQTRHRVCNNPVPSSSGLYCNGRSFEVRNCNLAKCPVDGSWGHWSILSKCSVTCGDGFQQRTRNCDNPTPSFGGSSCTGVDKLPLPCRQIHCPVDGDWSEWVVWSVCSYSCGSGVKTRTRQCNDPSPTYGGVRFDGDWSKWSSWSTCTALCNGGIQERARTCDAPAPSNRGHYCNGTATESQPCNNVHCQSNV